jgi:hypothetical protein
MGPVQIQDMYLFRETPEKKMLRSDNQSKLYLEIETKMQNYIFYKFVHKRELNELFDSVQ